MTKPKRLYVCINKRGGAACIGPKSREIFRELHKRARERGGDIKVVRVECMGDCSYGPNVKIHGGRVYHHVELDDLDEILDQVSKVV
ncbi:(2Fe-2S) ferredoxin domain-containing protein [Magnetovibrio sp. PR-2]|uniref:(2Fe-2S) ferredoxin domain-containing protein n=1 Tax=Magnetovibrio sp. PR-2 TaxID=3120356 RepID=UPI002FCE2024